VYSNTDDFSTLKWNGGAPIAGSKGRCRYNNQIWPDGSDFPADEYDNCNRCTCDNGKVECSEHEKECLPAGRASETRIIAPTESKDLFDCQIDQILCEINGKTNCQDRYKRCLKHVKGRGRVSETKIVAPTERKRSSCRDGNNNIRPHLSSWDELETPTGRQCYKECYQMTCEDGLVFCDAIRDPLHDPHDPDNIICELPELSTGNSCTTLTDCYEYGKPCGGQSHSELGCICEQNMCKKISKSANRNPTNPVNSLTSYSVSKNLAGSASETRIVVPTERKRNRCRNTKRCKYEKHMCHRSAFVRKHCAWTCFCTYPISPAKEHFCDCE